MKEALENFLGIALMDSPAEERKKLAEIAIEIRDERVPDNPMNAAKALLAFAQGITVEPHEWMLNRSDPDIELVPSCLTPD